MNSFGLDRELTERTIFAPTRLCVAVQPMPAPVDRVRPETCFSTNSALLGGLCAEAAVQTHTGSAIHALNLCLVAQFTPSGLFCLRRWRSDPPPP
jgi:hypothetical protein